MHIELAELLRCPEKHEETFLVVSTDVMEDRVVNAGTIGCPVCRSEFVIRDGVALFATTDVNLDEFEDDQTTPTTASTARALLNLSGPGGNVALIGSSALLAEELAGLVEGVHFVAVNPPGTVRSSARVSVLRAPGAVPLRDSSMRGVVVGASTEKEPWIEESGRVLLRGTRWLGIGSVECPAGVTLLARDEDLIVGEKA